MNSEIFTISSGVGFPPSTVFPVGEKCELWENKERDQKMTRLDHQQTTGKLTVTFPGVVLQLKLLKTKTYTFCTNWIVLEMAGM